VGTAPQVLVPDVQYCVVLCTTHMVFAGDGVPESLQVTVLLDTQFAPFKQKLELQVYPVHAGVACHEPPLQETDTPVTVHELLAGGVPVGLQFTVFVFKH